MKLQSATQLSEPEKDGPAMPYGKNTKPDLTCSANWPCRVEMKMNIGAASQLGSSCESVMSKITWICCSMHTRRHLIRENWKSSAFFGFGYFSDHFASAHLQPPEQTKFHARL